MNLNALIQGLRNVTWLLQKQRHDLPDFETWYNGWTQSVSDDAVMKWLVRSRNRIVKESDLELLSTAKVRISLDWLHEYESSWVMPPRLDTRNILIRIMSSERGMPPVGMLTIERRWIDKLLPEWELLDSTAHAYDHLVQLMLIAHGKIGINVCNLPGRDRECVTAKLARGLIGCMSFRAQSRLLHIDLSSRTEFTEGYRIIAADEGERKRARERYGTISMTGTVIELVPNALEIAKRMLSADAALMTVAWIIRGRAVVQFHPIDFPNREAKRLMMHRLADRVAVLNADGVIFIGESWIYEAEPAEGLDDAWVVQPAERANRREVIQVVGITRDGQTADRTLFFERGRDGKIIYGKLWVDIGGEINFLEPIRQKWAAMDNSAGGPSGG